MLTNVVEISKADLVRDGKDITETNPFYYTLFSLLKYYFIQQQDIYLMSFMKDITNSEMEFKVFMIYIEFSLYLYEQYLKGILDTKDEDLVYAIVAYTKRSYDLNHNVLKPFINTVEENKDLVIDNYNTIKQNYKLKKEAATHFTKLNSAIVYLEKSKELETEAKKYASMAIDILQELKNDYKKTIYSDNFPRVLIKNE